MDKKVLLLSFLFGISVVGITNAEQSDPRVYSVAGIGAFLTCGGTVLMYNACKIRPSILSIGTAPLKFAVGLSASLLGLGLTLNATEIVKKYDELSRTDKVSKVKRKVNTWLYYVDEEYALSEKWASVRNKVSNFFSNDPK